MPALTWLEEQLAGQGTTAEEVVREEHQRQGASNVTVRNIITSMRLISELDWSEFFESVSLVDEALRAGSDFALMDFATRNLYRSAVEELARGSKLTELQVVSAALAAARQGTDERTRDPGYQLISSGRRAFEESIGYRAPPNHRPGRWAQRRGAWPYIGAIHLAAALAVALALTALHALGVSPPTLALLGILGFIPALGLATELVNRTVTITFGPTVLPALALREGVPAHLRAVVAVPTLLTTPASIEEELERLEIHHLASSEDNLHFALLSDWVDAATERTPEDDALLATAARGIARLNRRYGPAAGGDRFIFLHRRRVWCEMQGQWIGWERKRGKLHELNRLLRGATDTTFLEIDGQAPVAPEGVRYVITLDADTRLPREAARRLIGKLAHPLNRPRFDMTTGRVVEGYAVLQPRVTPSLPTGREGSLYQRVASSAPGLDPYASAVSDVYQDLFGEGSYAGKGIYDVDAFEAALAGRVGDGTLLSHDLFEGIFARAALVSDVEVVEEFPARYDVAAARQHRWARGDWQLLPWLVGRRDAAVHDRSKSRVSLLGAWKMLDNLRRTLSPPAALAALTVGWMLQSQSAALWTAFIVATIAVPALLPVLAAIVPRRAAVTSRSHLRALGRDIWSATLQIAFQIVFLPHQAWLMLDAIGRTLYRLFVSRRNLLQWTTAAQAALSAARDVAGVYRRMGGGIALTLLVAVVVFAPGSDAKSLAAPFLLAWTLAPLVALVVSRRPRAARRLELSQADARELRLVARRTWRYFETFVTAEDRMLPPDNFQEDPDPVLAHRTSPTNLGSVPAVDRERARLRVDRHSRRRRTSRGHARHDAPPAALSRALLQLVRHARPASAGSALRVLGGQRQPRRASHHRGQRGTGVDRGAAPSHRFRRRPARCAAARPGSARRHSSADAHSRRSVEAAGRPSRGDRAHRGPVAGCRRRRHHIAGADALSRRNARRHRSDARERQRRGYLRRPALLVAGGSGQDRELAKRNDGHDPKRHALCASDSPPSQARRARWRRPWSSTSCSIRNAACFRSAIGQRTVRSIRVATTSWPRRPGSRVSSPSPRATFPRATGSGWVDR